MLVGNDPITSLSAFSNQSQPHLPPCDTLSATLRLASGSIGTFNACYGSKKRDMRFLVVGNEGHVDVTRRPRPEDGVWEYVVEFETCDGEKGCERFVSDGVVKEVEAFGRSVVGGRVDVRGEPGQAFVDLAVIEAMLRSEGKVVELERL
ncbi:hypothetical protein HDU67_006211 [Dinochytrium kinnereticum]|nr:hypothetical protein HDU67_006211 [Dinochytrium kinnereticum]